MVKKLMGLSATLSVLMLSGCGQSILDASDARCPFKERGGCQSMEAINRQVTEKRFTPDGQFVAQAPMVIAYSRVSSRFQK